MAEKTFILNKKSSNFFDNELKEKAMLAKKDKSSKTVAENNLFDMFISFRLAKLPKRSFGTVEMGSKYRIMKKAENPAASPNIAPIINLNADSSPILRIDFSIK
jgi:hypothetical protein